MRPCSRRGWWCWWDLGGGLVWVGGLAGWVGGCVQVRRFENPVWLLHMTCIFVVGFAVVCGCVVGVGCLVGVGCVVAVGGFLVGFGLSVVGDGLVWGGV